MKQKADFALPRAAYPQLERILPALYICRNDLNLKQLKNISNINPGEFSGNYAFLIQTGVVREENNKKFLTELGEKLCKSIHETRSDDTAKNWISIISSNSFLKTVQDKIKYDDGQDQDILAEKIINLAGREKSKYTIIGAKTLIEILKNAGLIKTEKRNRRTIVKYIGELKTSSNNAEYSTEAIIFVGEILPEAVFIGTRGYIERLAEQVNASYEKNLFDGCAVLMRRLIEILLIHSYQNIGEEAKIKVADQYKDLSVIIKDAKNNPKLNLSKKASEKS